MAEIISHMYDIFHLTPAPLQELSARGLKMAEITSDVYDIFHPTPLSLQELSAIVVSLQVWRCKMKEFRNNSKLFTATALCPSSESTRILLKSMLPDLPSVIFTAIDKYVRRFGYSLKTWQKQHDRRIFYFYHDYSNSVLDNFDDFVCDYTGAIDYLRTAERMMHCDRFYVNQKFAIACTYFFEDDIKRLWPLVSINMELNGTNFSRSPQLYYWICCLTNNLDKIPTLQIGDSVEKRMLYKFMPHNRPSVEYFWDRIPLESRFGNAIYLSIRDTPSFVRFILLKLNDEQLKGLLNVIDCYQLVFGLFGDAWYDKERILSTWMYVIQRRAMNVNMFIEAVQRMLTSEVIDFWPVDDDFKEINDDERPNLENWRNLCCEIWTSAPEEWKREAVVHITSNTSIIYLYERYVSIQPFFAKHLQLLPTILSCATSEERRRFWNNCWQDLIKYTWCEDLSQIMNLCFESEDEINEFKRDIMAHSDNMLYTCTSLLKKAFFDELNDLVSFVFSQQRAARNFKQQLLQQVFLDRVDIGLFGFSGAFIRKGKQFVEFVDDAYADVDRSAEFKNKFVSSPEIQKILYCYAVDSEQYDEFMDSFVSKKKPRH